MCGEAHYGLHCDQVINVAALKSQFSQNLSEIYLFNFFVNQLYSSLRMMQKAHKKNIAVSANFELGCDHFKLMKIT